MAVDGERTPGDDRYRLSVKPPHGSAQFGCNMGSGPIAVKDGWLIAGEPWISTVAGCPKPEEWRRFDRRGNRILSQPLAIERSGGNVRLRNSKGSIDLRPLGPFQLAGTRWSVVSVNDQFPPAGGGMQFKTDGTFTASFGCNGMGGSYRQEGANFRIGSAYSTERECLPGPGAAVSPMAFEEAAFKVLREGPLIERSQPGIIGLRSKSGQIMLSREPAAP